MDRSTIQPLHWHPFLDRFSNRHNGWALAIDDLRAPVPERLAEGARLVGLRLNPHPNPSLCISMQPPHAPRRDHVLCDPVEIQALESDLLEEGGVEIRTARGLVRLHVWPLPTRAAGLLDE
jgi:hypothetical protein